MYFLEVRAEFAGDEGVAGAQVEGCIFGALVVG